MQRRRKKTDLIKRTQAERAELSDQRMIEAAMQLIDERGIIGLRITEVGVRAGYSRGLAAMRFGTRVNLLSRVAQHAMSGWISYLQSSVQARRGLDAIVTAIETQARWMAEQPQMMRTFHLIIFQGFDPGAEFHFSVQRMLAAQRRDMSRWLKQAIDDLVVARDLDVIAEAEQILAGMVGIIYHAFIEPGADVARMHTKLAEHVAQRLTATLVARQPRSRRLA